MIARYTDRFAIIRGMMSRGIKLTKGLYATIDEEDYERCTQNKWHVTSRGYAARRINDRIQYLHRFLLDVPEKMEVDHINGDPLDNRKSNLRICTRLQNVWNMKRVNKFGYKCGVVLKKNGKWQALITTNKVRKYLGQFSNQEEASKAYEKAALEQRGEFIRR